MILFVKNNLLLGELNALSIGTRIDVDECACVTPTGILVLSLSREIYQKLGIEGSPWSKSAVHLDRYGEYKLYFFLLFDFVN